MSECKCDECKTQQHDSDCAVHNEPATPSGDCDCEPDEDNKQEFNEGHIIEGLDRLHVITTMLHEFLADHPAILKAGLQGDVHQAAGILLLAYDKVAKLDD